MSGSADARPLDLIERVSLWLSAFCMIGMVVLTLAEVVARSGFNSTTEHSDELVGYLLVGVSFFSLALCQSRRAFHHVEVVQGRLGPRGRAVSGLIFDLLSFGYIALTDWYFLQFVISSYVRGSEASTLLATPLWIPETAMVVGGTLLLVVLGKAVVEDVRKLVS